MVFRMKRHSRGEMLSGHTHTHTHRDPTTVILAVHARQGLITTVEYTREKQLPGILDECLAFLASGSDPTVPSLEALNSEYLWLF